MGYDAPRKAVKLVDKSYVTKDFAQTHDLGSGKAGASFEHPYSDLGHGMMKCDWEEGINFERMRAERLAKAREALAKADVDALFCFRLENVRYLTSYRSHGFPMMFWGLASVVLMNDRKTLPSVMSSLIEKRNMATSKGKNM